MPKALANKTDINFMILLSIFVKNYLLYDAVHDFSVWPRTGSNPADINLLLTFNVFQNYKTAIKVKYYTFQMMLHLTKTRYYEKVLVVTC